MNFIELCLSVNENCEINDTEAPKALDIYIYCSPLRPNHSCGKRAKQQVLSGFSMGNVNLSLQTRDFGDLLGQILEECDTFHYHRLM